MGINYFILHQIDFRRAPIRVLPCRYFYFQFKTESPVYEDYDEITELGEDNSEALAAHGWISGRSCWLYVFPDGTLGHCSPEDSLPNILIGLALSLLLSGHLFYVIYRIYRCKSSLFSPYSRSSHLLLSLSHSLSLPPFGLRITTNQSSTSDFPESLPSKIYPLFSSRPKFLRLLTARHSLKMFNNGHKTSRRTSRN